MELRHQCTSGNMNITTPQGNQSHTAPTPNQLINLAKESQCTDQQNSRELQTWRQCRTGHPSDPISSGSSHDHSAFEDKPSPRSTHEANRMPELQSTIWRRPIRYSDRRRRRFLVLDLPRRESPLRSGRFGGSEKHNRMRGVFFWASLYRSQSPAGGVICLREREIISSRVLRLILITYRDKQSRLFL